MTKALKMIDDLTDLIDSILNKNKDEDSVIISSFGMSEEKRKEFIVKNTRLKSYKIELYSNVKDVLDKHSVCHWIDCGTLLGAFRNNEMIPHDHDIDIAVHQCDLKKFIDILQNELKLVNSDYVVQPKKNGQQINVFLPNFGLRTFTSSNNDVWSEGQTIEEIWLDLYEYKELKDNKYLMHSYSDIGETKHLKTDIFPLNSTKFEGILSFVPNKTEKYLKSLYGYIGEDCKWDEKLRKYVKR
eukprot:26055_1